MPTTALMAAAATTTALMTTAASGCCVRPAVAARGRCMACIRACASSVSPAVARTRSVRYGGALHATATTTTTGIITAIG